jgi:hopanoid biosynthesis associated protein HpnK
MKKLIVNADDFGLHESVNQGILEAYKRGIVTSTSLMAGGDAFDDAVNMKRSCPGLGVGVHLTLVGAHPVSALHLVPSLVDDNGRFPASYPVFLARLAKGRIRLSEVERELAAQIDKVLSTGLIPSHLDSHQHLHVVPGISGIVLALARRFSLRAIRIPAEPLCFMGGLVPSVGRVIGRTGLSLLAENFRRQATEAEIAKPDRFYGMLAGGQMNEARLLAIISQLPDGVSEIMVHPGVRDESLAQKYPWGYHWNEELTALCAEEVKTAIKQDAIQLISFQEL